MPPELHVRRVLVDRPAEQWLELRTPILLVADQDEWDALSVGVSVAAHS